MAFDRSTRSVKLVAIHGKPFWKFIAMEPSKYPLRNFAVSVAPTRPIETNRRQPFNGICLLFVCWFFCFSSSHRATHTCPRPARRGERIFLFFPQYFLFLFSRKGFPLSGIVFFPLLNEKAAQWLHWFFHGRVGPRLVNSSIKRENKERNKTSREKIKEVDWVKQKKFLSFA